MYNCVMLLVGSYGDEITLNTVSNHLSCFSDEPFTPLASETVSTSGLRRVLNNGMALDYCGESFLALALGPVGNDRCKYEAFYFDKFPDICPARGVLCWIVAACSGIRPK